MASRISSLYRFGVTSFGLRNRQGNHAWCRNDIAIESHSNFSTHKRHSSMMSGSIADLDRLNFNVAELKDGIKRVFSYFLRIVRVLRGRHIWLKAITIIGL